MFHVDYDKVIDADCPACIKLLAMQTKSNGYTTPGAFLQGLSNEDVCILMLFAEKAFEAQIDDPRSSKMIMLLTIMLYRAEGVEYDLENADNLNKLYIRTCIFITAEGLKRKGLVELNYNGFTYDLDSNEIIAKPIQ